MKRLAIAIVVVLAVAGAILACPRSSQVRPDSSPSPSASPIAPSGQAGGPATAAGVRPGGPGAEAAPAPSSPEQGDEAIRKRLNLQQSSGSPVVTEVMSYTPAEHRILAEVERKAGSIPPGVKKVVERRRAGGTYEELQKLAQEELKGSLVARAAVLQWLDEEFAPKVEGTPGPGQPVVKPLTK